MKLRFAENSLRIRVRKSELEELKTSMSIEETISFGVISKLKYRLAIDQGIEEVVATSSNGQIIVSIPSIIANQWISSNQVSIIHNQEIEGGVSLHILVEKDFPCLDREEEDKSDTFWELAPDVPDSC